MSRAAEVVARPNSLSRLALFLGLIFQLVLPAWSFGSRSQDQDLLSLQEAQKYMLELINRDRESQGVPAVTLDTAATAAAQGHSDEMAQWNYISHWDKQGRKPDQRYSEAGGHGAVFENVYTNHDVPFYGSQTPLAADQNFPRREIEKAQAWFLNSDGHRGNVFDRNHNRVGIGLSFSIDKKYGSRITVAQEFVNEFVSLADAPQEFVSGHRSRIAGHIGKDVSLQAVQICREAMPKAMTVSDLKRTTSYNLPNESVTTCYPQPYRSPVPVSLTKTAEGEEFSLVVQPNASWSDGLYYVIVWVRKPDSAEAFIGSTRTVRLSSGSQIGQIAAAL